MNRSPRRGRVPQISRHNDSLNRFKQGVRTKISSGLEVLHPPLKGSLRKSRSKEKTVATRCCYVSPEKKSFGQYFTGGESSKDPTEEPAPSTDQHQDEEDTTRRSDGLVKVAGTCWHRLAQDWPSWRCLWGGLCPANTHPVYWLKVLQLQTLLKCQYDFQPGISAITNLVTPKNVSHVSGNKIKTSPQCTSSGRNSPKALFDESQWQKLDSPEEVDTIIRSKEVLSSERPSKHIFISDVPRVKVIAEKFSKYKRGNLELRRLDEKVVCVEYDIFNQSSNHEVLKPVQRMRTFFSIKPLNNGSSKEQGLPKLPPHIKNEFDVIEEDFEKLTEKEIEFIDKDIEDNQSYLDDLRSILKRKEVISAHKNKTTLDLQCLYEMARRDRRPLDTDLSETNLLSKAELKEVKQLILQRCTSSVHGFRRRTIKKKEPAEPNPSFVSDNIMSEMLRCRK